MSDWQREAAGLARDLAAQLAAERERAERLMLALEDMAERLECMRLAVERAELEASPVRHCEFLRAEPFL